MTTIPSRDGVPTAITSSSYRYTRRAEGNRATGSRSRRTDPLPHQERRRRRDRCRRRRVDHSHRPRPLHVVAGRPTPGAEVDAVATLAPLAERLLERAADVLASPPARATVSAHLYAAISALLAHAGGFPSDIQHRGRHHRPGTHRLRRPAHPPAPQRIGDLHQLLAVLLGSAVVRGVDARVVLPRRTTSVGVGCGRSRWPLSRGGHHDSCGAVVVTSSAGARGVAADETAAPVSY
ncbi:hypothetical protein LV75_001712 [Actinokineospora diospyrosa]|uniref:Uncharacterized protein n=1 Tax=Actinokineospora diospyrosa TaxID=103728 RepID=A0ABT1I9G6_9PSEU|nr:hypothetical protein [Actinokineospora diospyrosa]